MPISLVKMPTKHENLYLRVGMGHFATSHSHINYFIDVTVPKTRLSEARAVSHELAAAYKANTIVDTILCLDGTEVIGACLASELTREGFMNINSRQEIHVVTPEHTAGSQLLFRENLSPMITGKHVLVLAASVTTGFTMKSAIEAVRYYGGQVVGLMALFATVQECEGIPITSLFDPQDLPDYRSYDAHSCPWCQRGMRIEALVNSYGYSSLY